MHNRKDSRKTTVTIVRVGATKKYSDGWESAFTKGKSKSAAPPAAKKSTAKGSPAKKASAKKAPGKKGAVKPSAKKKTTGKKGKK